MKLRLTTALAFIFMGSVAYAGASDSLNRGKATSHFQLLIGNYVGQSFFAPHSYTQFPFFTSPDQIIYDRKNITGIYGKPDFTLMYSYSLGFDYKADLTKHIGIRTGINSFTYAYIAEGSYDECPICASLMPASRYKRVVFVSSFHIPLQLVVYQPLKKGRFVFSAGPDLYLPINTFGKQTIVYPLDISYNTTKTFHSHVNSSDFFRGGSMGFSLGLGYEKVLTKKLSIELMPDIRVMNLVPFDFQGQGTGIYRNYIFNTTVGLSTYLSFTK